MQIVFPQSMDQNDYLNIDKIKFDVKKLEKQIEKTNYYIYSKPQKTDYETVAVLGFEPSHYLNDTVLTGQRIFGEANKEWLSIDSYGCFTYFIGLSSQKDGRNRKTDKECARLAYDYLSERGLMDGINKTAYIGTSGSVEMDENGVYIETASSYSVSFNCETIDGYAVSGQGITVTFDSSDEIYSVHYKRLNYTKKEIVNLIPIEDALAAAKRGNCMVDVETVLSENSVIDSVEMCIG